MLRRLLLVSCMFLVVAGAARADAQEPTDPEPIPDFWTVEADAIKREQAAPDARQQVAGPPPAPAATSTSAAAAPQAAAAPAPAARADACTPQMTLARSVEALRRSLRLPLPHRAGRTVSARITPCAPGRLTLVVRHGTKGPVLARATRTLRTSQTATLRLRTTRAVERLEGKRVSLRLQVTLDLTL